MDELTIWCVIGLGAGLFGFFYGFKRLRIRQRVLGLPTSRIRSMAMGTIELAGRVRLDTDLVDPIFSRPCAYFKIVVKERRRSGKHSKWVTIYRRDSSGVPFLIDDGTGTARINPTKAEIHFPPEVDEQTMGFGMSFSSEAVKAFVSSVGGPSLSSRKIKAHILREGQPVFTVGFACPAPSAATVSAAAVSRDAAKALKSDPAEMKKLDLNRDGTVDAQEWDSGLAKKSAELADQERARQLAEAPPAEPLITVARCPDGLFLLADTQDNLLSRLSMNTWLGVIGGPVLAIASMAYLYLRYHSSF